MSLTPPPPRLHAVASSVVISAENECLLQSPQRAAKVTIQNYEVRGASLVPPVALPANAGTTAAALSGDTSVRVGNGDARLEASPPGDVELAMGGDTTSAPALAAAALAAVASAIGAAAAGCGAPATPTARTGAVPLSPGACSVKLPNDAATRPVAASAAGDTGVASAPTGGVAMPSPAVSAARSRRTRNPKTRGT